jgi:hypothetical protein
MNCSNGMGKYPKPGLLVQHKVHNKWIDFTYPVDSSTKLICRNAEEEAAAG